MKTAGMTVNRTAICANGQENYQRVMANMFLGKTYIWYDYTHTDGTFYSTVKPTLAECRDGRDKWLMMRILTNAQRQEIRQDGLTRVWSGDGLSMAIMFGNLTGAKYTQPESYSDYVQKMTTQLSFKYGKIELVADGVTVATGTIRETL